MTTTQLLELDERRRTSLGKVGRREDTRYIVEEHADGTIVLTPAVVLSKHEVDVLANPELVERIRAGVAEAQAGKVSRLDEDLLAELEAD